MISIILQEYFWASKRSVAVAFIEPISRPVDGDATLLCGLYSELAGHCVGLLVFDHRLFVLIDGDALEVKERQTSVTFQQNGKSSNLQIRCGNRDWRIN